MAEIETQVRAYWADAIADQPAPDAESLMAAAPSATAWVDVDGAPEADAPVIGELVHDRANGSPRRSRLVALIAAVVAVFAALVALLLSVDGDSQSVEITPADTSPTTGNIDVDATADEITVAATDGSMSITWQQLDDISAHRIESDGTSFYAFVDDGQIVKSDDGKSWQPLADLPEAEFDDVVTSGKVLHTAAQPDGSIAVQIVTPDGTVIDSTTGLAPLEQHGPFAEGVGNGTIAPIGSSGFVLSGNYMLDDTLIIAAGLGVPIDEILAAKSEADSEPYPYPELMAGAFGVSIEEYKLWEESEHNGFSSATAVGVEGPNGDVTVELSSVGLEPGDCCHPLFFQFVSPDGLNWTRLGPDAPRIAEVAEIEGGVAARVIGPDFGAETIAVSSDGLEWTTVLDDPDANGVAIGGAELISGPGRALWLTDREGSRWLWEITLDGAVEIDTSDTNLAQIDPVQVSSRAGRIADGEAGVAFLTGFTEGNEHEFHRPGELVVSIDDDGWATLPLPDELVAADGTASCCEDIAVGAAGVVFSNGSQAWLGTIEAGASHDQEATE